MNTPLVSSIVNRASGHRYRDKVNGIMNLLNVAGDVHMGVVISTTVLKKAVVKGADNGLIRFGESA